MRRQKSTVTTGRIEKPVPRLPNHPADECFCHLRRRVVSAEPFLPCRGRVGVAIRAIPSNRIAGERGVDLPAVGQAKLLSVRHFTACSLHFVHSIGTVEV
jgi:hypothetical protein